MTEPSERTGLPGFRTGTLWKQVVGGLYYAASAALVLILTSTEGASSAAPLLILLAIGPVLLALAGAGWGAGKLAGGGAVGLLAFVVSLSATGGSAPTPTVTAVPSVRSRTPSPPVRPTMESPRLTPERTHAAPSATPVPIAADSTGASTGQHPRLGGTRADFRRALGDPVRGRDEIFEDYGSCGRQFRFSVQFDGNNAHGIIYQRCGNNPIDPYEAFLPADAGRGTSFTSQNGTRAMRYESRSLAMALSKEAFVDCEGEPVPGGTLSVAADRTGWVMDAGTCVEI